MPELGSSPRNAWTVSANHADLRRAASVPKPVTVAAQNQDITLDLARACFGFTMICTDLITSIISSTGEAHP